LKLKDKEGFKILFKIILAYPIVSFEMNHAVMTEIDLNEKRKQTIAQE
jgi:hypothetical protein